MRLFIDAKRPYNSGCGFRLSAVPMIITYWDFFFYTCLDFQVQISVTWKLGDKDMCLASKVQIKTPSSIPTLFSRFQWMLLLSLLTCAYTETPFSIPNLTWFPGSDGRGTWSSLPWLRAQRQEDLPDHHHACVPGTCHNIFIKNRD